MNRSRYADDLDLDLDVDSVVRDLTEHLMSIPAAQLEAHADRFAARGFVVLEGFAPEHVHQRLAAELLRLVEVGGVRRDFAMEQTGGTPRRMRNVRREQIFELSGLVPRLYGLRALRDTLARVAREPVHVCPYEPEQCVITQLGEGGDTHGWHWDDYAFALVWVAECPPIDDGGFVQCVPRTRWDKENPRINAAMAGSVIHTVELAPSQAYFMRTDTTMHRVAPVERGRRTILNMGFAAESDLHRPIDHGTMDTLWAEDAR